MSYVLTSTHVLRTSYKYVILLFCIICLTETGSARLLSRRQLRVVLEEVHGSKQMLSNCLTAAFDIYRLISDGRSIVTFEDLLLLELHLAHVFDTTVLTFLKATCVDRGHGRHIHTLYVWANNGSLLCTFLEQWCLTDVLVRHKYRLVKLLKCLHLGL